MNLINDKQNEESSIDLLAAQRQMYSSAKIRLGIYATLAFPVIFILNIVIKPMVTNHYAYDLTNSIAVFALFLTLVDIFWLKNSVLTLQEKAATIQEEFDRRVYGFPWDSILNGEKVSPIEITKYSRAYKNKYGIEGLKNWYSPDIQNQSERKGILLCQNENLGWDVELRRAYIYLITLFSLILLLITFGMALYFDTSLNSFIMSFLIPSMPLLAFFRGMYNDQMKAIKDKESLKKSVENALLSSQIKKKTLEHIQLQIFNSRKSNPLIFDWFNKLYHKNLQSLVTSVTQQST
ncbi:hypothetical protein C5F64_13410 [Photobacterium damselae subsp. damselae]|uniref:S-4TM family putative pore-forming effector n=1 Tax=Photobacterium damselae TaxID=38293 RepID=UPI000D0622C4|nr:S-4TM family putative pore-forming effector [Photobacterium damselae]PSB84360.1 hypothetical protein C5F64_13410 [Photobacterium damselae subsp. damselae]